MNDVYIKIIAGVIGTLGFAIIFNLRLKHIPFAVVCGLVAGVVYFVGFGLTENYFVSNILASFAVALCAGVFAQIAKAPSTVFLIPGCIMLVPGGSLYYSMSHLLTEEYELAGEQLLLTVEIGIAIGGGIIAASLVMYIFKTCISFFKKNSRKKSH